MADSDVCLMDNWCFGLGLKFFCLDWYVEVLLFCFRCTQLVDSVVGCVT